MRGTDIFSRLPPKPGDERDSAALDAIYSGNYVAPDFVGIPVDGRGHHGTLFVSADTLRIGEPGDSCRFMVTATMAQKIADALGFQIPTTKMCDMVHESATVIVEPYLTTPDDHMADTQRMVDVNAELDRRINGREGLASSLSKDWCLSHKWNLGQGAVNYGYFSAKAPYTSHSGLRLWQQAGTRHNLLHQDSSQQFRCILGNMILDGEQKSVADVLMSADLSELLSDEGAFSFTRQPGIPLDPAHARTDPPPA